MAEDLHLTRGGRLVRLAFNPNTPDSDVFAQVDALKSIAARFINMVDEIEVPADNREIAGEIGRLKSLAVTQIETASMWAVKAATT